MFRSISVRSIITIAIILIAVFYLFPTFTSDLPEFWKKNLPKDKIHLGLDLQGGMHLVLEVDADKAIEATMERSAVDLKEALMDKRIRFRRLERTGSQTITLELPDSASRSAFDKALKDSYPDFEVVSTETVEGTERVSLGISDKRKEEIRKLAIEQSLETIRNRVDQFGISEPEIVPQGKDRILIQLPGIKDPARAKNLIGKTALLEFKLVDDEHSIEEALKGNTPEGDVIAYGWEDRKSVV
jgi:preprotein translocase subunit SecD